MKATVWENIIRTKIPLKIVRIEATSEQKRYTAACITDGGDFSRWIADNETQPQIVTLELDKSGKVFASHIRFQKDSSTHTRKVETSIDGKNWELLYERECTGWDFKPVQIGKELKYMHITIEKSSEGAAGLAEVTMYK